MAKRILVPIESDERSESIVPVVAGLAHGAGSSVRLLRVFPVPEQIVTDSGRVIAYVDQEMSRLTGQGLGELAQIELQLGGIPVERVVRFGEPVDEIALEADAFGADLIAIAGDRPGRVQRAIAPGLADRVVAKTDIPILVLR